MRTESKSNKKWQQPGCSEKKKSLLMIRSREEVLRRTEDLRNWNPVLAGPSVSRVFKKEPPSTGTADTYQPYLQIDFSESLDMPLATCQSFKSDLQLDANTVDAGAPDMQILYLLQPAEWDENIS